MNVTSGLKLVEEMQILQDKLYSQSKQLATAVEVMESVLWIDKCRCDVAYTGRGRHEPNTYCGELDPLRDAISKIRGNGGRE